MVRVFCSLEPEYHTAPNGLLRALTSLLLLAGNRRPLRAVIQTVNLVLHFGGKTNAMKFIAASQTAHGLAHFANLANLRTCVTVFNVNAAARFGAFACV